MRRDAYVCSHCRRESQPFEYGDGRWWEQDAEGSSLWLDERSGRWRSEQEQPASGPQVELYDLVLTSVGPKVESVTKILAEARGESRNEVRPLLEHMPRTVTSRVGFATAEGVRSALAHSGADVEVKPV
jgi:ribosomal protein L7/L12